MDEKVKRLINWMNGRPQPPFAIELIPTNKCNFNCVSCWRKSASKKGIKKRYGEELSDKRLIQLIDEASELGVKEIAFVGGGEPLYRGITLELMKRIKSHNISGDLVTNGSLLNKEIIEALVNIRWDRVKFSIDGSTSRLQDNLRGKKCFDRIIKNIKLLNETKKTSGKMLPMIGFNVVVSNRNYKDLPNIVELAHEVGCNELLILPVTVFSKEGESLKMSQKQMTEFQQVIKKCLPKLKEYDMYSNMDKFTDLRYIEKTNSMHELMMEESEKAAIKKESGKKRCSIKSFKENFKLVPCFEPWLHITIIANGNIACCFNNYVWETNVSVKDHKLKELWYGPYFETYRKQILTRKLSEACATCCVWRIFEVNRIRKEIELRDKWRFKIF